jgi:hypothetical protein
MTEPTESYGILLITDAIEGVHLIVTNEDHEAFDLRWLNSFLHHHVSTYPSTSWIIRHEFEGDAVPREVRVWPDLNGFLAQFGMTVHRPDGITPTTGSDA